MLPDFSRRSWTFTLGVLLVSCASAQAQEFPAPVNTEPGNKQPISPQEALAKIDLPPGFQANLFAFEPQVQNPISLNFDTRGRAWVAENYTYAWPQIDYKLKDRIIILADTDGDGTADKRDVFTDQLQTLTSALPGRGGVWAMCPPQLLFIPDQNQDNIPDGAPQVILDGFTLPANNFHNLANGLSWGPDGWLYGRCGASCPGDVGAPGTPPDLRIPLRGGMWRYHVESRVFETLASGTTNPWGHDWDQFGELFFINTVCGHLWHAFPGAHFVRSHTLEPHPYAYTPIDQHADHFHFDTGLGWRSARTGVINNVGGGHAHEGLMIYQGSNWPATFRNQIYTLNFHGRRINQDLLERQGSGYVAKHAPDMAVFGDPWFRGIDMVSGPEGAAYILDWSDTGECHEHEGVHRTSGRIYRISYRGAQPVSPSPAELFSLQSTDLVKLLAHENIWHSRTAARILLERHYGGDNMRAILPALDALVKPQSPVPLRLRALWLSWQLGGQTPAQLRGLLRDPDEHVRSWAIRFLTDEWPLDTVTGYRPPRPEPAADGNLLANLAGIARLDTSPVVRLTLASMLQRLPQARRSVLADALMSHAGDAGDHNLPLMIWYGLSSLSGPQLDDLARIGGTCQLPVTRQLIVRRLTEEIERAPGPLNRLITSVTSQSPQAQLDVLTGMSQGLAGWPKAPAPAGWTQFVARLPKEGPQVALAKELGVLFGDGRAIADVKALAQNAEADIVSRKRALATLIEANDPDIQRICQQALRTMYLNTVAVQGLAKSPDPVRARQILDSWALFAAEDRPQVSAVLVSRPTWAGELLQGIEENRIPRDSLSAFQARQIQALNDPNLTAQLTRVWGEVRDTDAARQQLIDGLKPKLTPTSLLGVNLSKGRALFVKNCAACHVLYGEGGKRGPDLTGSQRFNADYLLRNIVDPSQEVSAEFRMSVFELKDGRVLTGIVGAKTDRTVTILTPTETLTIEQAEIEQQKATRQSLMPDGLLTPLTDLQQRELLGYLMHDRQVPVPE